MPFSIICPLSKDRSGKRICFRNFENNFFALHRKPNELVADTKNVKKSSVSLSPETQLKKLNFILWYPVQSYFSIIQNFLNNILIELFIYFNFSIRYLGDWHFLYINEPTKHYFVRFLIADLRKMSLKKRSNHKCNKIITWMWQWWFLRSSFLRCWAWRWPTSWDR